jgi:hypothetical protein
MSSSYVRGQIQTFMTAASSGAEVVIDVTGDIEEINDFLTAHSLTYASNWVGLYYVGHSEDPITVPATNVEGCYREDGSIFIHVVAPASVGCHTGILTRAEVIRNYFRGKRINDIEIQSVSPCNFNMAESLDIDGGFTSGVVQVDYQRDLNL